MATVNASVTPLAARRSASDLTVSSTSKPTAGTRARSSAGVSLRDDAWHAMRPLRRHRRCALQLEFNAALESVSSALLLPAAVQYDDAANAMSSVSSTSARTSMLRVLLRQHVAPLVERWAPPGATYSVSVFFPLKLCQVFFVTGASARGDASGTSSDSDMSSDDEDDDGGGGDDDERDLNEHEGEGV
jgi:hypothetical protein